MQHCSYNSNHYLYRTLNVTQMKKKKEEVAAPEVETEGPGLPHPPTVPLNPPTPPTPPKP